MQSRYYNPKTGRFLNADAFTATGQGMLGNNMFAYCGNNPAVFSDPSGYRKTYRTPVLVNNHDDEKDPLKWFLTHMARPRREGNTFSVGLSGGSSFGSTSNGKTACISVDSSHNYALQETTSLGVGSGVGGSAGIVITYTSATNVQDLAGASMSYGGTIVPVVGISIDYVEFIPASNPKITCWGVNVVIAAGGEGEIHASQNYTTSSASWNPFIALRDWIYGG